MPRPSDSSDRSAADAPSLRLEADHVAFIAGDGISCSVAARDASNQPSVAKALAVRVLPDRRTIEVFVDAERSVALLRDLRAGSPLAFVCSEPASHRTMQLKGSTATLEAVTAPDVAYVAAKVDAVVAHISPLGYRREGLRAYFGFEPATLTKIVFVATAAFAQTPGPGAGARLGS
jgi:hypothetical protein